ncbi:MAG: HIT family protein [Planctomycetota bacterium]
MSGEHGRRLVVGQAVGSGAPGGAPGGAGACAGCARVARARAGQHPFFVAELRESLLFLHDDQRYTGHCVLFLKTHGEHLHGLAPETQAGLAADVADAARVQAALLKPKRINYECLGNVLAHIHWHVIPRYEWDPEPQSVIWVRPAAERASGADGTAVAALAAKMRAALADRVGHRGE